MNSSFLGQLAPLLVNDFLALKKKRNKFAHVETNRRWKDGALQALVECLFDNENATIRGEAHSLEVDRRATGLRR